jgi:hypothetical protein
MRDIYVLDFELAQINLKNCIVLNYLRIFPWINKIIEMDNFNNINVMFFECQFKIFFIKFI